MVPVGLPSTPTQSFKTSSPAGLVTGLSSGVQKTGVLMFLYSEKGERAGCNNSQYMFDSY